MSHRRKFVARVVGLVLATQISTFVLRAADVDKSGPLRDITFNDIKFEMQKEDPFQRSLLTPQIEKLDGKRIRIRGYMRPGTQQSGITRFILVRDNLECCFGPGAYLYDCIIVDLAPGVSVDFSVRPVTVEGTFTVAEVKGPDDRHWSIYHLTGEKAK